MVIKFLLTGFFTKLITGLDDTIIHIPIISNLTKTKKGRFAFLTGIFFAIILAIIISIIFSEIIKSFTYYQIISATLILILAISIYFDILIEKPRRKIESKIDTPIVKKEIKQKNISAKRFFKLIGIGFVTAFATVIDDTIAYSSLFLVGNLSEKLFVISGIVLATIIQLFLVFKFSKKIQKIKCKKQITVAGLTILSILIALEIL